jgi:hypothetical protein
MMTVITGTPRRPGGRPKVCHGQPQSVTPTSNILTPGHSGIYRSIPSFDGIMIIWILDMSRYRDTCPDIGTCVPISVYPDIGPDSRYRDIFLWDPSHPISGMTRYPEIPDIWYFPISGISRYRVLKIRPDIGFNIRIYGPIRISGHVYPTRYRDTSFLIS